MTGWKRSSPEGSSSSAGGRYGRNSTVVLASIGSVFAGIPCNAVERSCYQRRPRLEQVTYLQDLSPALGGNAGAGTWQNRVGATSAC
jgi:hypothetical protein